MEQFLNTETLIALFTLTAMETVLGIDNIIFISILVAKLDPSKRDRIRNIGITLALIIRLGLLFSLSWIMSLTEPFMTVMGKGFSGRDIIMLAGGLFLIAKATYEIHHKVEGAQDALHPEASNTNINKKIYANVTSILVQILLLDIVFSLDSVITAVGMAQSVTIMILAVIISMIFMLKLSGPISDFVEHNPTIKILALSFLILRKFTFCMVNPWQ